MSSMLTTTYNDNKLVSDTKNFYETHPPVEGTLLLNQWDEYVEDAEGNIHLKGAKCEEKHFECDICGHRTKNKNYLIKHLQITHGKLNEIGLKWFYCKNCVYRGRTQQLLNRHMAEQCENKWLHCDKCSFKSKIITNLNQHQNRVHKSKDNIPWLHCRECEYCTQRSDTLKRHHKSKHTKIKDYKCEQCRYKTDNKHTLQLHVQHKHIADKKKWFECTDCKELFKSKLYLAKHLRDMHKPPAPVKWYKCEQCTFQTKYKRSLSDHTRNLHGYSFQIKWHECDQCNFKTKYAPALQRHKANYHALGQSFRCNECFYLSKTRNGFNAHFRRFHQSYHKGKGTRLRYECFHCGYQSYSKYKLKHHLFRIHSKKICSICNLSTFCYDVFTEHQGKHRNCQ